MLDIDTGAGRDSFDLNIDGAVANDLGLMLALGASNDSSMINFGSDIDGMIDFDLDLGSANDMFGLMLGGMLNDIENSTIGFAGGTGRDQAKLTNNLEQH